MYTSARNILIKTPQPRVLATSARAYATQYKAPRDSQIKAKTIRLVGLNGQFLGEKSLTEVLNSYDPSRLTLLNLSPTQEIPTCRLYEHATLRELESLAYKKKREKAKIGSDPSKVLKECKLGWNVTSHDLEHKLESGLAALRKGHKVDVSLGVRMRRGAKLPSINLRKALLGKVIQACGELGNEHKAREGDLDKGVIIHYLGHKP